MTTEKKIVKGELLNQADKKLLADVNVEVALIFPSSPQGLPKYKVFMWMNNYRPELANKTHYLKLEGDVCGKVFIAIDGIPSRQKTKFKVNLQDNTWNNLDWFRAL